MQTIQSEIIETILNSEYADDKLVLDTISLLNLKSCISQLEILSYGISGLKMNQKRRTQVNVLLRDIVFYCGVLIHSNDLPIEYFDVDELTLFADEAIHPDYHVDPILCCNHMMMSACDLMEEMFDLVTDDVGEEETDQVTLGETSELPGAEDVLGEDDEVSISSVEEGEPGYSLAVILAGAIILADKHDTDFGIVMQQAAAKEEV